MTDLPNCRRQGISTGGIAGTDFTLEAWFRPKRRVRHWRGRRFVTKEWVIVDASLDMNPADASKVDSHWFFTTIRHAPDQGAVPTMPSM